MAIWPLKGPAAWWLVSEAETEQSVPFPACGPENNGHAQVPAGSGFPCTHRELKTKRGGSVRPQDRLEPAGECPAHSFVHLGGVGASCPEDAEEFHRSNVSPVLVLSQLMFPRKPSFSLSG